MTIIRGEKVTDVATLSPVKELFVTSEEKESSSFVDEECAKAFQKGQESGEKLGYERALAEMQRHFLLIQILTQKLLEHKQRLLDRLKPEVIEFSIAICERVIRKELSQPEAIVKLINSLLSSASASLGHETLQIVLAPEDLVLIEGHLNQIQFDRKEIENVRFSSDSTMRRGDCRIETPSGLLNYTIARELSDLQDKVLHG